MKLKYKLLTIIGEMKKETIKIKTMINIVMNENAPKLINKFVCIKSINFTL